MQLYRIRYYDKFSYLGKYYNHDVWTDKAVADIACIKINIKHEEEYGENICYVEPFFSKS